MKNKKSGIIVVLMASAFALVPFLTDAQTISTMGERKRTQAELKRLAQEKEIRNIAQTTTKVEFDNQSGSNAALKIQVAAAYGADSAEVTIGPIATGNKELATSPDAAKFFGRQNSEYEVLVDDGTGGLLSSGPQTINWSKGMRYNQDFTINSVDYILEVVYNRTEINLILTK